MQEPADDQAHQQDGGLYRQIHAGSEVALYAEELIEFGQVVHNGFIIVDLGTLARGGDDGYLE